MARDKLYLFCAFALGAIFLSFVCFAQDIQIQPIAEFTEKDRILILAPHPDDEAIGAGGVIQKVIKAGAQLKIALFTNGDNNELAFIVYEKRLTLRKKEFLHMGEVRRKETLQAMDSLGLSQDNIIFLGYPDFGTMEILTKYWGETKPYRSMFPRVTKVSYPQATSPNAPYVGESILKDLKKVILDFKPTKIFVSHPADANRDHRALYLFLQVALWELEGRLESPEILPYIIHVVGWPKPRGYHPDLELSPPDKLSNSFPWQKLDLTEEEIKAKNNAISFYKSQIEADPPYLFTFARKNELFGNYPLLELKRQAENEINWQDLEIEEEVALAKETAQAEGQAEQVSALAYALQNDNLFVRLMLKRKIDKEFGISIFLLGYSKKIDFAKMPKIRLIVGLSGLRVKDKKQTLFIKDIQFHFENKALIFKVPLSVLGNPDYILSFVRTHAHDLPQDETIWRTLCLE